MNELSLEVTELRATLVTTQDDILTEMGLNIDLLHTLSNCCLIIKIITDGTFLILKSEKKHKQIVYYT